ncbi:hypothetical protein CWM47_18710 [Spirosoma pollinicola]|uniref:Uncharacterized protein n=1 Tax=Spirosoma pollinicola TaxID=2057025 RepID=A0A2K8Z1A7_9BACT|nr:hypothetical protein CWM47_18710 [Spirosoma pollinicola]
MPDDDELPWLLLPLPLFALRPLRPWDDPWPDVVPSLVVVPLVDPSLIVPLLDEFVPMLERRLDLFRFILPEPDVLDPSVELVPIVDPLVVPLVVEEPF